jgi:hypothetical protein
MNKSKIKGTAYETAVVRHLNDNGFPCGGRVTEVTRADGTRFTVTVPFMGMEPETDGARYFHAWIREHRDRVRSTA